MNAVIRSWPVFALILLGACLFEPEVQEFVVVRGNLACCEIAPQVSATAVGSTLALSVTTLGANGCWARGELRYQRDDARRRLFVTPFDRVRVARRDGAPFGCTDQIATIEHSDTIRIQPGSWTVSFHGSRLDDGSTITIDRTVEVPGQ